MNTNHNSYFLDEVNTLSSTDYNLLISMAEEIYHNQINDIANDILQKGNIKIVLVAGPSSSGKTTTSNRIRKKLEENGIKSVTVSLDDFFLNREKTPVLPNGKLDFENITALDIDYLNIFIDDLFEKNSALMPIFDFIEGKRKDKLTPIEIDDKTVVIIEGIHALNPTLITKHTQRMYKVYICVNSDFSNQNNEIVIPAQKLRLMRRLNRDFYTRGRTIEKTLESWNEVLEGENLYIKPYKNQANYIIDSTHMYEPLMYAKHLLPLLEKATQCQTVLSLKEMLKKCNHLDKSLLPEGSLLHEFLD